MTVSRKPKRETSVKEKAVPKQTEIDAVSILKTTKILVTALKA